MEVRGSVEEDDWSDWAAQEAVWRDGWGLRRTEVAVVRGDAIAFGDEREVVDTDLGTLVQRAAPTLDVVHSDWPVGCAPSWWVSASVLHLALLVADPSPRTGSRWGWFLVLLPPSGTLAHALLGMRRAQDRAGPRPVDPSRAHRWVGLPADAVTTSTAGVG